MGKQQPSSFGIQLRRHREAAGLTQEVLAERSGLAVTAISALERGLRQHPYPHTVELAACWAEGRAMTLDQAITYALDETGEPRPISPDTYVH